MTSKANLAVCPACGKRRDIEAQVALRRAEKRWFRREALRYLPDSAFYPLTDGMRRLARHATGKWFWACDACIDSGRALAANVTRQHLGLGTPFAAYVDRPFQCTDCGKPSVFSAAEQKHWFEKLQFLIWVYPKQCAACRAVRRGRKRSQKSLAKALHGLDPSDPEQLESVSRLYTELGLANKAREYRARASNRRRARTRSKEK